jgi:hypothetical protein
VQRMYSKQRRDKRRGLPLGSQPAENSKKQKRIDDVENDVCDMLRSGSRTKEPRIEHMGQPCCRHPESRAIRGERPPDVGPGWPVKDVAVFTDILKIVIQDETVVSHWSVDKQVGGDQRKHDPKLAPSNDGIPCRSYNNGFYVPSGLRRGTLSGLPQEFVCRLCRLLSFECLLRQLVCDCPMIPLGTIAIYSRT